MDSFLLLSSLLGVLLLALTFPCPAAADPLLCHPHCHCLDSFFDCTNRDLNSFPFDFPPWITKLNVSNNKIGSIEPSHLSRLVHLESLSLDGNNLTVLPSSTERLESLLQLTLSRNGITRLDAQLLSPFPKLHELDLSRNRLDLITNVSFPRGNQLDTLNLASNSLETLESGSMTTLSSLTELNLSKNRLRSIAKDALAHLTNLERLDLSRNKLEMMDSLRFQELKKLQVLNLRRNHMSNLSDAAFYGLEKIQQLYLDWNSIRVVDKRWLYGLRTLRTLNLSHNQVNRLEDDSWEFMEQVQTLDLSFNQIQDVSRKTLAGLFKLRSLDLSNNLIVDIQDDAFLSLDKLEILDLSFNQLSWVLEDVIAPFRGLKECHTLNLASNQIHTLHPEALQGLSSLRFLNLSANPITWLSEKAFMPIPNVQLVLSEVNTLVCDCESQWLHALLTQANNNRVRHGNGGRGSKKLVAKSNTVCAFPAQFANRNLVDLTLHDLSCSEKYRRPVFLEQPKTQIFLMEGNGTLTCHLQSSTNVPLTVQWRKDHRELPKELLPQVTNEDRVNDDGGFEVISKLNLINVTWVDSGQYQCVGLGLGVVYSVKANVTVHIYPQFVKKPSNVTVRLGSNAKLECGAKGFPTPEIAFQKDGGEDFPAALERRFHVMPNDDSFFIMEVKLADMGVYSCSAKNSAGEIRANATVTVFETPRFSPPMEDEIAVEGSNAILECLASGSPTPQISWNKEGVQIVEGPEKHYHLTENASLLLIKDVQSDDEGRYECVLTNAVGTARGFLTLTVLPKSAGKGSLDNAAMTIIFIIIAVFCVVGTSAAWVVVIYRTRKRKKSVRGGSSGPESAPLRHKYDDFDGPSSSFPPLAHFNVTKIGSGDSGSQSSSGKDSGNGEDIPESLGVITDGEDDHISKSWKKRKDLDTSFSTFGARACSTSRLSQARLDLKNECDNNMISLTHTGKEFASIPRRVPIPVPPPYVCLHVDTTSGPAPIACPSLSSVTSSSLTPVSRQDDLESRPSPPPPTTTTAAITSISTPV